MLLLTVRLRPAVRRGGVRWVVGVQGCLKLIEPWADEDVWEGASRASNAPVPMKHQDGDTSRSLGVAAALRSSDTRAGVPSRRCQGRPPIMKERFLLDALLKAVHC